MDGNLKNHFLLCVASLAILLLTQQTNFGQTTPVSTRSDSKRSDSTELTQVEQIDGFVEQIWEDYGLKPSKMATDGEWCRRVYLDIIGRTPSAKEALDFISSRESDKRKILIETLLYDDNYTEEFARNWTTVWTNLLIGRTGGNDNNSMISRPGMQKFLRDSFAREKPYDKMVHQLVTATGTTTPGDKDFNGATNFLIDKVNEEKASLATAATTKIFMGLQVQCTQCHNHPFNDWKQQKYWEVNAFFRQVRAFRGGMRARDGGVARLADQDFKGETGRNSDNAEIFYEKRNGEVSVAYPVFVDGSEIETSGLVNVVNRRQQFADKMVESPYFTKSIANRMWAHFLGYGFTSPVDDLGPHNIPSNPELLEYLGQEFRSSGFDLRQLISWIALSKPYALSSRRTASNKKDDPLMGEAPRFSHFYLRQMEAEQLYESLAVATEASKGSYEEQEQRKNRWLNQFTTAFGTDEGQETTSFNGTIPQVLMLFNGEMIKEAIKTDKGSMIDRLVNTESNFSKMVAHLFLAGLSRRTNGKEKDLAKSFLKARGGDQKEALRDMWWVVLNTNEFIFNH
jgi:hypothetical protein